MLTAEAYASARSRALRRFWGAFFLGWAVWVGMGLVMGALLGADMDGDWFSLNLNGWFLALSGFWRSQ